MTEQRDPRTKLLAEAFHEDWPAGATAVFARRAATLARQRRRLRQALVAAGATTAVALLLILSLVRPTPNRDRPSPVKAMPAYEIISDEELLAQFPGRPLLLVDKGNGTRELVLLDGKPAESGVK